MANATKYVDNVNGNNGNTGDSEAQAYADIATALAALSGGGNTIYLQAGANYTLTATITWTAALKGDTTDGRNRIIGYTTTPGAADGRPIITSATNSVALITMNDNDYWEFRHISFTHTAATRGNAIVGSTSTSSPIWFIDCVFDGCLAAMTSSNFSAVHFEGCEIKNCTTTVGTIGAAANLWLYGCDIHDNAGDAVRTTGGTTATLNVFNTIIDTNAIGLNEVGTNANFIITVHDCVIVDNTSDGIKVAAKATNSITFDLQNNIIYGNGGYGINNLDTQAEAMANLRHWRKNAFGANATAALNGLTAGADDITLTGDPFTNKASRDFSLDATANEGGALRAVAFPTTFPGGTTTSYRDVGVAQHQDSGSGGGVIGGPNMRAGMMA